MGAFGALGHALLTIAVATVVLTVLVYVHELGHYLFARWFGMRVNAFAIFMGGYRKTDLSPYLERPIAPALVVWSVFALAFVGMVAGALVGSGSLYFSGLAVAGVVVPIWTILRLSALYHVPLRQVLLTWGKSLAVGAVVLVIGTRFQGVSAEMGLGVATGASLIALMLVYYLPVQMKEQEDDKQGFGEIVLRPGEERVPVRYRPLWARTSKSGTEFSLLLLPIGGFAAIRGMQARQDGSEVRIEDGFYSRPPWQRLITLFAGPFFSVLFGIVVMTAAYSAYGKEVPDDRPIVGGVDKDGGAAAAGIQKGDTIVSIDGQAVPNFYTITKLMHDKWREGADGSRVAVPVSVTYRHDGLLVTARVVPKVDEKPGVVFKPGMELSDEKAISARLGVMFGTRFEPITLGAALGESVNAPIQMVAGLTKTVLAPSKAAENVAGPTAMAQVTSAVVQQGLYNVLVYAGLLSVSLGVMNLLPIVPLDGGQMLVAFVEMLRRGRRLSFTLQTLLANSGFALLVVLMLAVSAVDLGRTAESNREEAGQARSK